MTHEHFFRIPFVIQINSVGLAEGLIQEINKRERESHIIGGHLGNCYPQVPKDITISKCLMAYVHVVGSTYPKIRTICIYASLIIT